MTKGTFKSETPLSKSQKQNPKHNSRLEHICYISDLVHTSLHVDHADFNLVLWLAKFSLVVSRGKKVYFQKLTKK